jgi:hypothetical protein
MAVALLALVVAMGGTAVAGDLINGDDIKRDTVTGKQVKESSLAKVPKATKADGMSVLPAGKLMHGVFGAGASNDPAATDGYLGIGLTYPRPLASPIPDENIIDVKDNDYTNTCPGPGQARAGYLCLYNKIWYGVEPGYGYSENKYLQADGKSLGVVLYWTIIDGDPYVGGSWTLRAPSS